MSKIIKLDDLEIEPLTEMCRDAYEETAWALENTLKKAIHFGRLLCIAKKKVPHGKWISWVAETFEDQVSLRNIQRFMQVADSNTTDPSLLEGAKNLDEAMGRIQMKKPVDNVAAHEPRDIAAEVAAECGVTQEQIIQDGIYAEAVDVVSKTDPDIRAKVRAGTVTQAKVIATAKAASTAKPTAQRHAGPVAAARQDATEQASDAGNNAWSLEGRVYGVITKLMPHIAQLNLGPDSQPKIAKALNKLDKPGRGLVEGILIHLETVADMAVPLSEKLKAKAKKPASKRANE